MEPIPLAKRIALRLNELDVSPIKAARDVGLGRDFLRDLIKGKKRSVSEQYLPQVAQACQWTLDQLMASDSVNTSVATSMFDLRPIIVPEIDLRERHEHAEGLSRRKSKPQSARPVRAEWGLPVPFLKSELHMREGRVEILVVRGDSMEDLLRDGDRALIDLDDVDVSQGGIFAVMDSNRSTIIQQVELVRGAKSVTQRIRCKSRNPKYDPFELELVDPVQIIGRVACRITRI